MSVTVSRKTFDHDFWSFPSLRQEDRPDGRVYWAGKEAWPSVTTYIGQHWDKSFLDEWRTRVGAAQAAHVTKISAERGDTLHKAVESYLMNEGVPTISNPHLKMLFNKIRPKLDNISRVRLVEKALCSVKMQVAGRPDCIGDYEGRLAVIDLKSSGKVKHKRYITTYFLQCGFYGHMVSELYGQTCKDAVIIMGTEDSPTPQVFKLDMDICMDMVVSFRADPVKFQEKMQKLLKAMPRAPKY